jgi:hypothetical protein
MAMPLTSWRISQVNQSGNLSSSPCNLPQLLSKDLFSDNCILYSDTNCFDVIVELEDEADKEDNVKVEALKNLITHPAVLAGNVLNYNCSC